MASVLDPVAAAHAGEGASTLTAILDRTWREEFGSSFPEPTRSRCAAAIRARQPWWLALWSNDWPYHPASGQE
jgi:hypothetical protein